MSPLRLQFCYLHRSKESSEIQKCPNVLSPTVILSHILALLQIQLGFHNRVAASLLWLLGKNFPPPALHRPCTETHCSKTLPRDSVSASSCSFALPASPDWLQLKHMSLQPTVMARSSTIYIPRQILLKARELLQFNQSRAGRKGLPKSAPRS